MKQFNFVFETRAQLFEYLRGDEIANEIHSAKSVLIQLYSEKSNIDEIDGFITTIKIIIPNSIIIGATSAGQISNGKFIINSCVISLSIFHSTDLVPISETSKSGAEYETGTRIAKAFSNLPNVKGILLLASPVQIDCSRLLQGINDQICDSIVFGGGAAGANSSNAFVFIGEKVLEKCGVVAVGLQGDDLFIESTPLYGWKALGPRVSITEVNGFNILGINGKPAFDVYSKYFDLKHGDDLFLLEFPLLIERNGMVIARNPISSGEDGSISMIADTYTGESARLGYLDINEVLEDVHLSLGVMKQFNPEAIFIYSCICRRFALQQDIEMELSPFNEIAPVSGFYTYGEFCSTATRNEILNSSEVVIGIREGMLESKPKQVEIANQNEIDYYKTRHIQIMSRLLHFISALTDQLDEANQALKFQAEHDQLTEALNRHAFKSNLDLEISHSNQLGHRLSFILFDIDHFKLINDKYGHLAGDHVLKCVVEVVQKSTRGNDTLYRYGGEEFLLLLPETALDGAIFVAEKIRKNIETTTIDYEGNELPSITASFGVACYPDQDEDVERLMSALDQALYQSKSLGRNRTSIAHR